MEFFGLDHQEHDMSPERMELCLERDEAVGNLEQIDRDLEHLVVARGIQMRRIAEYDRQIHELFIQEVGDGEA